MKSRNKMPPRAARQSKVDPVNNSYPDPILYNKSAFEPDESSYDYRNRLRETTAYPPNFQVCHHGVDLADRPNARIPDAPPDSIAQLERNAWHRMMCKNESEGKFNHMLPAARMTTTAYNPTGVNWQDEIVNIPEASAEYVTLVGTRKVGTGKRRKPKTRKFRSIKKVYRRKNKNKK